MPVFNSSASVYVNGKGSRPQHVTNGNRFQNQPQPQPPVYNQALSLSKLNLNQMDAPENGLRYQNQRSVFAKSTSHLNEVPINKPTTNGVGVHVSPIAQKYVSGRVEVVHSRPVSMQHLANGAETESAEPVVKLRNKKNLNQQISDNRRHTVTEGAEQNMVRKLNLSNCFCIFYCCAVVVKTY